MNYIYLDYAATSPMDPEVIKEINEKFKDVYGNASSTHTIGQNAKKILEQSREKVALLLNANKEDIFFTSSGTESNNWAIKGVAFKNQKYGNHIITSKIEHHAVLNPCQYLEKHGFKVSYLNVNKFGSIDLKELEDAITDKTLLISIMHANNEIGTIQPINEIGIIAKKHDIIFHTDAVQTFGKVPINVNDMNIDLLSASSHKLYGPKGVGLLYIKGGGVKDGWGRYIEPLLHGGGHEKGLRSSTENIPGIAGFAKAVELCKQNMEYDIQKLTKYRNKIIREITENINDVYLNGHPTKRLPNNISFTFKYVEGESIILNLDKEGIAVSTGSACSSKTLEPSHVLLAIGQDYEDAQGSLRISLGRFTSEEDVNYFLKKLPPIIKNLREISSLKKERKCIDDLVL